MEAVSGGGEGPEGGGKDEKQDKLTERRNDRRTERYGELWSCLHANQPREIKRIWTNIKNPIQLPSFEAVCFLNIS